LFEFHTHQLRVLPIMDDPSFWFVAKDIADILGHATANAACRAVPAIHQRTFLVPTRGGPQEMLCLDEAGLYRAVLRSDKPEAEPFMEWVTALLHQMAAAGIDIASCHALTQEATEPQTCGNCEHFDDDEGDCVALGGQYLPMWLNRLTSIEPMDDDAAADECATWGPRD
jgi:prophage antirepressor-like protein